MATNNPNLYAAIVLGDGTIIDATHPIPTSGGGGGGAVTIAASGVASGAYVAGSLVDGADTTQGLTTDAAVTGDNNGTLSAKLRGLTKILADVWDVTNHRLNIAVNKISGTISSVNSSTTTLSGNAAFTGVSEDVSAFGSIEVNVFTDQSSAAGGLSLQLSSDGTHWDVAQAVTISASVGAVYTFTPGAQFFRVVYTNGATPQGAFRLQTIYKPVAASQGVVNLQDVNATLSPTTISQRVIADITVQDPGSNLTNRVRSAAALVGGIPGGSLLGQGMGVYNAGQAKFYPLIGNTDGSIAVGGYTAVVGATLTRPANTTTYTANTAIANATSGAAAITFSNCARISGGSGYIIGVDILDEANQTVKGTFELWLYNQTPGTVINDNVNWAPANADLLNRVGIIKFDGGTVGNNASGASGNVIFVDQLSHSLPFVCVGSANLYGQIVVRNAYVPISSEVFQIALRISED